MERGLHGLQQVAIRERLVWVLARLDGDGDRVFHGVPPSVVMVKPRYHSRQDGVRHGVVSNAAEAIGRALLAVIEQDAAA